MKRLNTAVAKLLVIGLLGLAAREASGCFSDRNWPLASDVDAIMAYRKMHEANSDQRCFSVSELMTRGTLREFFLAFPDYKVVNQVPNGLIFTSPRSPKMAFLVVQVKSVQGNDILLGPVVVPGVKSGSSEELSKWTFRALDRPFDEERHYAALYADQSHYDSAMFVLYERRPDAEAVPIEYIYTYSRNPTPILLPESQNEAAGKKLRAGYGRGMILHDGVKYLIKHPAWIGLLIVVFIALALVPDRFRFGLIIVVIIAPMTVAIAQPDTPVGFRVFLLGMAVLFASTARISIKHAPLAKPNEAEPGSDGGSVSHDVAIPFNAKPEWPKAIPKICPKCHGDTESHSELHYCPYCGSNQIELQPQSIPPHCRACGSYFKDASESDGNFPGHIHYCVHCGFKLLA